MRFALPFAAVAVLAACASRPVAPATPAGPPAGVNGRYRGTARLVQSHDRFCPRSGPRTYEVVGDQVMFSYTSRGRTRVPLTATIGPDGQFQTSDGVGTLQGTVRDDTLEFTVASSACEHHWTMRKVY